MPFGWINNIKAVATVFSSRELWFSWLISHWHPSDAKYIQYRIQKKMVLDGTWKKKWNTPNIDRCVPYDDVWLFPGINFNHVSVWGYPVRPCCYRLERYILVNIYTLGISSQWNPSKASCQYYNIYIYIYLYSFVLCSVDDLVVLMVVDGCCWDILEIHQICSRLLLQIDNNNVSRLL